MNNTSTPDEKHTIMAHDGACLQLRRTLDALSKAVRGHHSSIVVAADEDFEAVFTTPAMAGRTQREIDLLIASLQDAKKELAEVEEYWWSLPWAQRFGAADPRPAVIEKAGPANPPPDDPSAGVPFAHVMTGPPGPDFEPDRLAAKRVINLRRCNDVRQMLTIGKLEVEHVIGSNKPVIWLTAVDGTEVVVFSDDLVQFAPFLQPQA